MLPRKVGQPWVRIRSLMDMGTPSKGNTASPLLRCACHLLSLCLALAKAAEGRAFKALVKVVAAQQLGWAVWAPKVLVAAPQVRAAVQFPAKANLRLAPKRLKCKFWGLSPAKKSSVL